MRFTIPLGLRERVSFGYGFIPSPESWTSMPWRRKVGGWWVVRWTKGQAESEFSDWNDDEPESGGVREPLRPRPPSLEGEIAVLPDDDDEFR
jgi:hypothetical protein